MAENLFIQLFISSLNGGCNGEAQGKPRVAAAWGITPKIISLCLDSIILHILKICQILTFTMIQL